MGALYKQTKLISEDGFATQIAHLDASKAKIGMLVTLDGAKGKWRIASIYTGVFSEEYLDLLRQARAALMRTSQGRNRHNAKSRMPNE